jgi:PAS domain S-box-containing protein
MAGTENRPTVLIVDDEPRILDSLRALLEQDFEVEASTDAHDALKLLQDSPVAVILVDQRMPGLTGDQFLAKAQELSDATRILITGYADIDALIRAVNHGGIYTYLPKPWEPRQLRGTVFKAAERFRDVKQKKEAAEIVAQQQEALARSEAALREQTKLLRSILDSMGDGVLVANESGEMLLFNPAARQLVGHETAGANQAQWSEHYGICYPDMITPYASEDLPLARASRGEVVDGVELYVKQSGIFVSVNGRPLRDDTGNVKGGVAVVRDITANKRAEEMLMRTMEEVERANRAKSEFLSRMSHELRTPLNSILGFAQILEMGSMRSEQKDSVEQILKGGQHLLSLINEVLDIARIEAGKLALSPEAIHVREAVDEALDLVSPLADRRQITVSKVASEDWGRFIQVDRQRLRQVILNLLSNAIKYNQDGGKVTLSCFAAEIDRLRIEVSDTGLGIAPNKIGLLFSPFERLGAEETGIEGTGIGLALSKRLVQSMGGTIGVRSELGVGTTFWIEFSRVEEHAPRLGRCHEPGMADSEAAHLRRTSTVLYIEDNVSSTALMERVFSSRSGVKLVSTMQGRIGLDLAREYLPDLILLDHHLPDMRGDEVLLHLRADPRTRDIPVAMVSADATEGQIHRLATAGAQAYFTKPLDVKELLAFVDATLQVAAGCQVTRAEKN